MQDIADLGKSYTIELPGSNDEVMCRYRLSDGLYQYTPSASDTRGKYIAGLIPLYLTISPQEYMPDFYFEYRDRYKVYLYNITTEW